MPNNRVALLIDADNAQLSHSEEILKFSSHYGNLTICHAYGDWKQSPLLVFRDKLDKLGINRIQVNRIGKDTTDKQLLIEAGEILGAGDADIFIIVSGDGDFRLLCERIKQKNRKVVGIGNKRQTSPDLQKSCDDFCYIEDLEEKLLVLLEQAALKPETLLREAYIQAQRPDGLACLSEIGNQLQKLDSGFVNRFGKKKLSKWLDEYPHLFKRHENHVSLL